MLNRSTKITFRLNGAENDYLKKRVKKSGLSQEAYLRHIIGGFIPTDIPPPDYYNMVRELHAIGNNLNQIAYKANGLNIIDEQRYADNAAALDKAIIRITEAVMLPRKIDRKLE